MSTRLDVIMTSKYKTRDGEEKTRWTRVGAAFVAEKLGGYNVKFDHPVTFVPGMNDLVLAEPKPKDEGGI